MAKANYNVRKVRGCDYYILLNKFVISDVLEQITVLSPDLQTLGLL